MGGFRRVIPYICLHAAAPSLPKSPRNFCVAEFDAMDQTPAQTYPHEYRRPITLVSLRRTLNGPMKSIRKH